MGVSRPGDHYAIVRARPGGADAPDGIGTMLVSRDPLSAADLDALEAVAARMKFEIVQSPRHSADDTFAALADGDAPRGGGRRLSAEHLRSYRRSRPSSSTCCGCATCSTRARWHDQGIVQFNMTAVGVLGILFVTVVVLTASCVVLPLWLARPRADFTGAGAAPRVLRRDRPRVHADRDLTGAAADGLPRPSRLQSVGRALCAAAVERSRQPFDGPLREWRRHLPRRRAFVLGCCSSS